MSDGAPAMPGPGGHPEPVLGWCAREVQEEFPELHLVVAETSIKPLGRGGRSAIEARLAELSNRWQGARAINLRRESIAAAYRVFFRHVGLDPDVVRTPIEAAVAARMFDGGFVSSGRLKDILLIALVDTSVPVWALDADTLDGPLGIRLSSEPEPLGRSPDASRLGSGRLVVADASAALAVLFGEVAHSHEPRAGTRRLGLFTVQVAGVPSLHVEEALWICTSALSGPG